MSVIGVAIVQKYQDAELEQALKQADASLRAEGLILTEAERSLIRLKLCGEISHDEFLKRALELAARAGHEGT